MRARARGGGVRVRARGTCGGEQARAARACTGVKRVSPTHNAVASSCKKARSQAAWKWIETEDSKSDISLFLRWLTYFVLIRCGWLCSAGDIVDLGVATQETKR